MIPFVYNIFVIVYAISNNIWGAQTVIIDILMLNHLPIMKHNRKLSRVSTFHRNLEVAVLLAQIFKLIRFNLIRQSRGKIVLLRVEAAKDKFKTSVLRINILAHIQYN